MKYLSFTFIVSSFLFSSEYSIKNYNECTNGIPEIYMKHFTKIA